MPAGKPNSKSTEPSLEYFLIRKKISLKNWLSVNSITSKEALEAFLEHSSWTLSPSIVADIQELVAQSTPAEPAIITATTPASSEELSIEKNHKIEEVITVTEATQPPSIQEVVEQSQDLETVLARVEDIQPLVIADTADVQPTAETEENITTAIEETPIFNAQPNIVLNRERKKNRY